MKFNGKDITELLGMNRRNFLKASVGGAVGIGLSPLPWKLTDDIAIWTQNWPWLTVPPDGEYKQVKSLCTLCPGGCGIEVRKVDNRAVKIEGRTDYPVNPGGICPLGAGGLQLLYNEGNRFTGPMKRVGPRGSGKFQNIGWDEALDTLTGRISSLREKEKPQALAAVDGNPHQSTISVIIERLVKSIGSLNYMRIACAEDTQRMTDILMQGNEGPMTYDLENSDYILSFGSGLLEGWGAPGRVINAWGIWKSSPQKGKVKIVQVESRVSNTASKADKWVPVKPGTETALALGIAHVLVKEGLYDKDFIEENTFGFSDWTSPEGESHEGFANMLIEKYSPENVEGITGIESQEIISLARDFSQAKAPIALCGKGKGHINGSLFEFMAVRALNALVGNINKSGGLFIQNSLPLAPLPDIEMDLIAQNGLESRRLDRAEGKAYPFTQSLFKEFTDAILGKSESPPIDTLLVFSSNPAFTLPDGGDFRRALEKIPFIASFSSYHDETAYMADLILPDHVYLEKIDDVIWPSGLQYPMFGLTQPVVDPIYDTMNSGDIIIQIANRMGGSVKNSFPWKDYEEVLKARVKGLFDSGGGLTSYDKSRPLWKESIAANDISPDYSSFEDMWSKIKSGGLWYRPLNRNQTQEIPFNSPTGKFEFYSKRLEAAANDTDLKSMGIRATGDEAFMPHFESPHSEAEGEAYPLQMVPYEMINLSNGPFPSPPYLGKTLFDDLLYRNDSFAEINPDTAAELNLKDGDSVIIESEKGKVTVRVNIFQGAMPGVVYLPFGLGHRAYDDFLRGKGANPNDIINGGKDPLSGHSVWWNTPVRIIKA